jgi:uncharacterized RDD family membrane protein YckC
MQESLKLGDPRLIPRRPQTSDTRVVLRRVMAALIDLLFVGVAWAVAFWIGPRVEGRAVLLAQEWLMIGLASWSVGYFILCEGLTGRTPGKWIVGIAVVDNDGVQPSWLQIVIRNVIRLVDVTGLVPVGLIVMLSRSDRRRVGDILARTLVIRKM